LIIDLCCGIGRFTGDDVISIDSNFKTKPTICADIRYLPLRPGLKPDHVHASPPCTYFSKAQFFHGPINVKGIGESLELVGACFKAFDYLESKHWTLENPVGYLGKVLNEKRINYKTPGEFKHKATHFWSDKRGLFRAIIPQDVRQELLATSEEKCR